MKVGKISESVLKRSVLKQIKSINANVISGAGVGADCAIFACEDASWATSMQAAVLTKPADIRYAFIKAANNIACSGAIPVMAMLSIVLPEQAEEAVLTAIMKEADQAAKEIQVRIAGGHTEISDKVTSPVVSVSMTGSLKAGRQLPAGAVPGQDVVISKWIGLEGTARLAGQYRDRLLLRYPLHMIDEAAAFGRYLSIIPEAATAVKSNVSAMHDVSTGGIFAALWELAESAGVGLAIDLKKIPVKQETIEVCEFFGISPYELLSGGCLLMTADNGDHLVQALEAVHIPAVVVGKTTDNHDRIVINEEERRFLERPKTDAILQPDFPAEP
ncbi:MAG: AIR synthase-related protein [Lachnospiraceae bacterium]